MSDKIEVNRRRVLGGLVTIGAAGAAIGAGTFAAFSDTETSSNNTVEAGTLSLSGTTDGEFGLSNIVPGESVPNSGTTTIQATYDNSSSIDAEVDVTTSISEPTEGSDPHSTDMSASQFAQQLSVDTANLTRNSVVEADLTSTQGVSTLDDIGSLTIDDGFGTVAPGDTVGLELAVTLNDVGNDYQADGVSLEVQFTAEQPSAD